MTLAEKRAIRFKEIMDDLVIDSELYHLRNTDCWSVWVENTLWVDFRDDADVCHGFIDQYLETHIAKLRESPPERMFKFSQLLRHLCEAIDTVIYEHPDNYEKEKEMNYKPAPEYTRQVKSPVYESGFELGLWKAVHSDDKFFIYFNQSKESRFVINSSQHGKDLIAVMLSVVNYLEATEKTRNNE